MQCHSCFLFLVSSRKKSGAFFTCHSCGDRGRRQHISRIFATSQRASDCRTVAQSLNAARGEDELARVNLREQGQCGVGDEGLMPDENESENEAIAAAAHIVPGDWERFLAHKNGDEETRGDEEEEPATTAAMPTPKTGTNASVVARWRAPAVPKPQPRQQYYNTGRGRGATYLRGGGRVGATLQPRPTNAPKADSSWEALVDNANGDEMKTTTLQPRASNATKAASPWAAFVDNAGGDEMPPPTTTTATTTTTSLQPRATNAPREASPWAAFLENADGDCEQPATKRPRHISKEDGGVHQVENFWASMRGGQTEASAQARWL